MRRGLTKFQWRTIFHRPTKSRLIVLQAKKKATLTFLTNADFADATLSKHTRVKPPRAIFKIRSPSTQARYNKYKCSGDLWNKMVLAYDHLGNLGSADVAVAQSFIHALTVQAFTYWRLATGSDRSHLNFRYDLLRHFAPTPRPRRQLVGVHGGVDHYLIRMSESQGRCARKPCTTTRCHYVCIACDRPMCQSCFNMFHGINA